MDSVELGRSFNSFVLSCVSGIVLDLLSGVVALVFCLQHFL